MPDSDDNRTEEFVQLWTRHAQGLYAYIMSLVFDLTLAEDILQESAAVAWKQFDEFIPGTNFRAWASKIAFHKSLAALRRKRQGIESVLDLRELELLSDEALGGASELDLQLEFLHLCLQELKSRDRDLLRARYRHGEDVITIAERLNRSASAVYKSLEAVHEWLFYCVTRKLRQETAL